MPEPNVRARIERARAAAESAIGGGRKWTAFDWLLAALLAMLIGAVIYLEYRHPGITYFQHPPA